jgi:transcriptional regulator with XRE-family HTH domain
MDDKILLNTPLIDRLRIERAMTRTDLARCCGFSQETRTQVSKGGPVSVRTLRKLAVGLGVRPAALIAETRTEVADASAGAVQAAAGVVG